MDGITLRPRDTSPETWKVQLRLLRQMTGEERSRRACELSRMAKELALAGIRRRFPQASAEEVPKRLAALTLGAELCRKVYGWDPEREGYWWTKRQWQSRLRWPGPSTTSGSPSS